MRSLKKSSDRGFEWLFERPPDASSGVTNMNITTEHPILQQLNPEQREAVMHREGPLLILAGAGTGKTRVITHRVAYLISQGIPPWNILAITFTNRASDEMKRRVHMLAPGEAQDVVLATFHSFCARLLRREAATIRINPNFVIYDGIDQKNVVKRSLSLLGLDIKKYRPGVVAELISRAKDDLLDAGSFSIHAATSGDSYRRLISDIYELYDRELVRAGALDFGDLIMKVVEALRDIPDLREKYQKRFLYCMVDEYQDTNRAQYMLVKYLVGAHKNIVVVGDDDQAIYRWRGADVRNILEFEKDFKNARVIKLEQNYRSTKIILDTAWQVIKNNISRKEKKLWTDREGGEPVTIKECAHEQDEAQFVAHEIRTLCAEGPLSLRDCAVFYRTNAQSRVLEDALRRLEIPYRIFGSVRFYNRQEIKDIIAYLIIIMNPQDSLALRRIINVPGRGIGKTTMELLNEYAQKHSLSLYETISCIDVIPRISPRICAVLKTFCKLRETFVSFSPEHTVSELVKEVLSRTGYLAMLEDEDTPEADSRIANLKELVTAVTEYEERSPEATLQGFMEQISLITDVDTMDMDSSYVTLMTLHLAKGLEYSHVFMTGMEEGLFPIGESAFDREELEEERRLAYVGMTRAKNRLYLSFTVYRKLFGQKRWNLPSRFIAEAGFHREREEGAGAVYERHMDSPGIEFAVGTRVRHPEFGEGRIIEKTGSGDSLKVLVQFYSGIRKKLLVKYAPVEKI